MTTSTAVDYIGFMNEILENEAKSWCVEQDVEFLNIHPSGWVYQTKDGKVFAYRKTL